MTVRSSNNLKVLTVVIGLNFVSVFFLYVYANSDNLEDWEVTFQVVGSELLLPGKYADLRAHNDVSDVETAVERTEERMTALRQTIVSNELV